MTRGLVGGCRVGRLDSGIGLLVGVGQGALLGVLANDSLLAVVFMDDGRVEANLAAFVVVARRQPDGAAAANRHEVRARAGSGRTRGLDGGAAHPAGKEWLDGGRIGANDADELCLHVSRGGGPVRNRAHTYRLADGPGEALVESFGRPQTNDTSQQRANDDESAGAEH